VRAGSTIAQSVEISGPLGPLFGALMGAQIAAAAEAVQTV
jgi:hypothetical protein